MGIDRLEVRGVGYIPVELSAFTATANKIM
jgi:hypothetical protein